MIIARASLRRKVQTISPFLRGQCPATKHPRRTGSGGLGTFGDLGSNVCTQNQVTAKKILEVRLAQRRVARGMRDRDVAEPVLNRPGVDAVIGQLIATAVPQHVEMHRQSKAGTLADDLDQAERAKLCKRMPQLSCKPPSSKASSQSPPLPTSPLVCRRKSRPRSLRAAFTSRPHRHRHHAEPRELQRDQRGVEQDHAASISNSISSWRGGTRPALPCMPGCGSG
jgi:hypothetical protein